MMRLSLMNRFMATLDKDYRSPVADAIAASWRPDPETVRFFRASANFVCVFKQSDARHFLRFNEISERNPALVEDEVRILNCLLERGISVSTPVRSHNGNYVELVTTESGTFAAVAFRGLAGDEVDLSDMTDDQLGQWGATMGRLHRTMKTMPAQFAPNRPAWADILAFAREFIADGDTAIEHELDDVAAALAALPRDGDNYGLIHFDFESDNLCWDNGVISALDFDDCARLWYAADIGYALRDLFKDGPVDLQNARLAVFVAGYRSETGLADEMFANLPLFMRLHRLFFIARLRRSVDIVDRTGIPEWVVRLGDKLSKVVERYCEDIRNGKVIVR